MLSTVILLPIIVLLVLLVSSSIIGSTAHIYVDNIAFADNGELRLKLEDEHDAPSQKLNVEIRPLNARNKNLIYESEDESVATVNEQGYVRAVDYGTTRISVKSEENQAKVIYKTVVVYDDKVHRLEWNTSCDELYLGDSAELNVGVIPKEATNQQIVWESRAPDIISVTSLGTITALGTGSAVIVAKSAQNPDIRIECVVSAKPRVTGIAFADADEPEYEVTYSAKTAFPAIKLLPEGADEKITYSSSDEKTAVIDEKGNIVFYEMGTVTFTASIDENITITKRYNYNGGYYTLLTFDRDEYVFDFAVYPAGSELPIVLTGYPPETLKDITLSYSREGVVTDSNDGIYAGAFYSEAPYDGGVEITASAQTADGNTVTARCFVYLVQKVISVTAPSSVTATDGICDLADFCVVTPDDSTSALVYKVTDETIATVSEDGVVTFLQKGSAVVTISDAEGKVLCTVTVVGDTAFYKQADITFSFEDKLIDGAFVTSLKEYEFTVSVSSAATLALTSASFASFDTMADETLKFDDSITVISQSQTPSGKVYECKITFTGKERKLLRATVWENGKITALKQIMTQSTYGAAKEMSFSYDGREIEDGENFTIPNIHKSIDFIVKTVSAPEDFSLSQSDVKVGVIYNNSDASYLYETNIEKEGEGIKVTLTSEAATNTQAAEVSIYAGGFSKRIKILNEAPSEAIEAMFDKIKLDASKRYYVFTDKISLTLNATRADGIRVTDREISWQYGEYGGKVQRGDSIELIIEENGELTIENGSRSFTVALTQTDRLSDFGLAISYVALSQRYEAYRTEKISAAEKAVLVLPSSLQGGISFRILLPDDVLGALGDTPAEMQQIIELRNLSASWDFEYHPELNEIILIPERSADGSVKSFDEEFAIAHGSLEFYLSMLLSDLGSLAFTGYDSENSNDVYKGLQQASAVAKHSYYDGKEVDYFKIPIVADGNIRLLQWTLSEINAEGEKIVTTQQDGTVYYNGAEYTLLRDGTLSDAEGNIVVSDGKNPSGITFVDPFTEEGFARIWFGNVKGLTEEDIKKDNFGDFDSTGLYNHGSGTFVRVGATNGTPVVSKHFDFNVLEDVVETVEGVRQTHNLVNVVDNEGFKANKYIVLHTDLYGPEEMPSVESRLVFDGESDEEVATEFIYGNGYSINYRKRSLYAVANDITRDIISVGRIYNVTMKGTTASTSDNNEYRICFFSTAQFYCTIQACKIGMYCEQAGLELYSKNNIYRYIAEAAIQLKADCSCTTENIVIVDALKGLEMWYDGDDPSLGFFILGFLDVLNYRNENEPIISNDEAVKALKDVFINELKKTGIEYIDRPNPEDPEKTLFWANIVMSSSDSDRFNKNISAYDNLVHFGPDKKTNTIIPYGDKEYKYGNSYYKDYNDGVYTWGLQRANSMYLASSWFDIGAFTYMDRQDICIGCQLLDDDSPNTIHLAWHMNRVYRNSDLVGWKASDHDANLKLTNPNYTKE